MLIARERESARIDEALDAARQRRSAALVVRGEAGIGKSALLDSAIGRAKDMRVFRALGVESEVEIAFSGLHELLRPALPLMGMLPDAQAAALGAALALGGSAAAEPLATFSGALSLLAAAADEHALLCVVDDAPWLDEASAAAMAFIARRLDADGIAMLFGVREPDVRTFAPPGVPELRLSGLARPAARRLLAAQLPAGATALVADQIIELAGGNPLALTELPQSLTAAELLGTVPVQEPFRVATAVSQGFLRRATRLPDSSQRALLLVAASDVTDLRVVTRALALLDLDASSLGPAETAGLITLGSTVGFSHPLVRSAVYGAAADGERNAAHRALAESAEEPDRQAWHLASATRDPDETLASRLVDAAESARRSGGVWAEAKALERAARLTPDPSARARRLARAGDAAYRAGRLERADSLLEEAITGGLEADEFARAQARRAYIRVERGELDDALRLMIEGADQLEAADPNAAATLLTNAATAVHHRLEIPRSLELAERAWQLAGAAAVDDPELCHIVSFQRLFAGQVSEAMDLGWRCAQLVEDDTEGRIVVADAASTLLYAGEVDAARRLLERAIVASRAANALGDLGYSLFTFAQVEWYSANLERAYHLALEAAQIIEELAIPQTFDDCLSRLAMFEAVLGRDDDSRDHARRALDSSMRLNDRKNEVRARSALGMLALSNGDAETALTQLAAAVDALETGGAGNPNQFRIHADLVEAYVRLGRTNEAQPVVASLERHAQVTGITWTLGAAMRCRALVTSDPATSEAAFAEALGHHETCGAFEHARTQLCFGETLRRRGLRRDSRQHLAAALETFERLKAIPWAERTRAELRASGKTVRRREPAEQDQLTPQELQIANLVSQGKPNRDIAQILFVSPKTVEFHLTRVYRKLEIHSRSELVRLLTTGESDTNVQVRDDRFQKHSI
ncbi:MAG: LuxR C-terminal-related transcriptional regulator [Gaiellaceae bacterium]